MTASEHSPVDYRLRRKLESGEWILSVELDPPHGLSVEEGVAAAEALREAGVDCVDVGDSPLASVRMSPLAFAAEVQRRTSVEAIVHFAARDRNLLALQADLLGGHMQGIRSVIALSGDPPALGRYANATGVWDVKAEGLIELIATLNSGVDSAGNTLGGEAAFTIAAAANPGAPNLDAELARLGEKARRGADVFFTQPSYELEVVERFLERAEAIGRPVILGVMPLVSGRNARYMAENVPGVTVPPIVVEAMERAGDGAAELGLEMAYEFIQAVRGWSAGVYVIPLLGKIAGVVELVRQVRR